MASGKNSWDAVVVWPAGWIRISYKSAIQLPNSTKMKHFLLSVFLVVAVFEVRAERRDYDHGDYSENSVYSQVHRRCPNIQCPRECSRYIGGDGCAHCGPCSTGFSLQQVQPCATPKCPADPNLKCGIFYTENGCPKCWCQPVKRCPTPQCSQNCVIVQGVNGCPTCKCAPRLDCPPLSCPPGCNDRYMGPDGCQHCDCGEEVAVCPEVACDFSRCRHKIDQRTGCAVGCECYSTPLSAALYYRGWFTYELLKSLMLYMENLGAGSLTSLHVNGISRILTQ